MTYLIRATVISRAGELIDELGGDSGTLLRAHGIDPPAIEDFNCYVRYEDAAAVLGHAARSFDCPDFGLRVGSRQGIAALGPLGVILRNAETVGDAVDAVCRLLRNLAPADTAHLQRRPTSAVYSFSTILRNDFDRRQMVEKSQSLAMQAFRVMIGPTFTPRRVTFTHGQFAPMTAYHDVFGCAVDFGCGENAIHLASSDLTREIGDRDATALRLAEDYLSRMRPEVALAEHVRDVTRRLLLVGPATLNAVAHTVSVHERTLQRELAAEGTGFEEILDGLRRTMAWELAATGMSAAQISRALGYAEQSSFSRACRRWFGEPPRSLLRRRRGQRPDAPAGDAPQ
ncbi:AraC family transcriptional regulator [Gordonia sp. TBRC 11910]|uniref:AraC family transcriptional regulator n=1 Tax=Gordonia asplenii TaxID=2725283 RepID=A0A848KXD3_9ACTN|nr:AraC family transcriptional regulator [Gordonia asplenii]NMO02757.1 AraC family transcriptional regulator [Gordonia asplenii]